MANQKKSFNFRHGVQVDDDNFIVDTLGKVGIGSTVPSEYLDVGGNIRIRGTVFADEVNTKALVNTGEDGTSSFKLVNVGITSLTTGIITSSDPNGIVTYYGDARYLQGMPTSQWIDTDVGLGYTSIYAAGNVGIATTDPRFSLQIGDTNSSGNLISGVGINSVGNIDLTGTLKVGTGITANSGVITANKFSGIGSDLINLTADNLEYGSIPSNRFKNIHTTGVITATSLHGAFVGIATTARDLVSTARIDIEYIDVDDANIGFGTLSNAYVSGTIGIGSTRSTLADIHIDTDGVAAIKIQSKDDESRLILGRNNDLTDSFAIVTDDVSSSVEDSGLNSVDIVNYNPGHLNFLLYPGTGTSGKRFNWINKETNTRLMSLTQTGELGIGITNPTHDLHVVGTSTVTENSFVGGDFEVKGSTTVSSVSLSGLFRTSSKVGIALTVGDTDPSYDFQVGYNAERVGVDTGAYIKETGDAGFSGILTATTFSGDFVGTGSSITGIKPENISSGTFSASNFQINSTSGIITAKRFAGSGVSLTEINPANISSGTIGATNFQINSASGIITASSFVGSGSSLTSINPANISSGTIDSANFQINATSGIITAKRFVGSGASLTNLPLNALTGGGTLDGHIEFTGVTTFTSTAKLAGLTIENSDVFINSTSGIITAKEFHGNGSNITGISQTSITDGTSPNHYVTERGVVTGIAVTDNTPPDKYSLTLATTELGEPDTGLLGIGTHVVGSISVGFSTHVHTAGVSTYIWNEELLTTAERDDSSLTMRVNYYSTDYQILAINGNNYQTSKVLVLYDGDNVIGIETYSNISINNEIAKYQASVDRSGEDRLIYLNAVPEPGITGLTTYKVHLSSIH